MRYKYYNANPLGKKVNDCTVRAISLATNSTWNETYELLSHYAKYQGIMMDEVDNIDTFLESHFKKLCRDCLPAKTTIEQFVDDHPLGTYLITMRGHITCAIDGCVYDTFNPKDRIVWCAYEIQEKDRRLCGFLSFPFF